MAIQMKLFEMVFSGPWVKLACRSRPNFPDSIGLVDVRFVDSGTCRIPGIILLALLTATVSGASGQELILPFEGRWFVAQGGDTLNVNHHMAIRAQWYGVDFAKAGGPNGRSLAAVEKPSRLEHFYSWNEPVLAPVEGTVYSVVNDFPDNAPGTKDIHHPAGNHVIIETESGTYVFLAHLKQGSVSVDEGDRVSPHQVIGRVGNSGNSDFPHVHVHIQDTPTINEGNGLNPVFRDMDVELNGQAFERVTWPVIRGLFVTTPGDPTQRR